MRTKTLGTAMSQCIRVTATLFFCGMCWLGAQASSITYVTPAGSMTGGGDVDASVTFTTGTGTIMVTLNNLEPNPTDEAELLSDLFFTVGNGTTTGASFGSGHAPSISVAHGGTFTTNSPFTTAAAVGWVLSEPNSTKVLLNVLSGVGHAGPANTIIGPPNASNLYSHANGSIAGNPAHNPFIGQTATWVINAPNVSPDTTITSATFSFGTTAGVNNITGVVIPEPSSMLLLGGGVLLLAQGLRRKLM